MRDEQVAGSRDLSTILRFQVADIAPSAKAILSEHGADSSITPPERIALLVTDALRLFEELAEPIGIQKPISIAEFESVYAGEGKNESRTPVADIFLKADNLTLFAVTLGSKISQKITDLFERKDFALGYLLDAAASAGADNAAELMEKHCATISGISDDQTKALKASRYSPGYCGWHLSGQKRLFEYLQPEEIGITLRESFIMEPLKSVSGVIIEGLKEIHEFENNYPCCQKCSTQSCHARFDNS